jgi:hypothetical protein
MENDHFIAATPIIEQEKGRLTYSLENVIYKGSYMMKLIFLNFNDSKL